jgi:hypothetical protein
VVRQRFAKPLYAGSNPVLTSDDPASSRTLLSAWAPLLLALAVTVAGVLAGCKPSYTVGDHVMVDWEGSIYPAYVMEAQGATKFKVHYDGYDTVWDEVVPRDRIRGLVQGQVVAPEPPAKVRAKAMKAAQTNQYKFNDHVRVEWHGQIYPATITGIVGQEKYRVTYDGYGREWDEIVGLSRIQPK